MKSVASGIIVVNNPLRPSARDAVISTVSFHILIRLSFRDEAAETVERSSKSIFVGKEH
jgi:hypothetical protein